MLPDLIALYSPSMGHGKTSVSKYLQEAHSYVPVKFAGTIKAMISEFLSQFGIPIVDIPLYLEGGRKEQPLSELGLTVSPRHLLQTLGTEWGRDLVNREVWVAVTVSKITRLLAAGHRVVVDDMRFNNEYDAMRDLGAVLIRVDRPGVPEPVKGHPSEGLLDHRGYHHKLSNDSTLASLQLKVMDSLMEYAA